MRALVAALALALATTSAARADEGLDRIEQILTPKLAAVLLPAPALVDGTRAARLAWMAELGRRIDAREHLSDDPAWRAIMGWPDASDDAALFALDRAAPDRSFDRYPVPEGRADPATDFAASVALAWLDPDFLSCELPLRARFLRDHGLAPTPLPLDAGKCPAFEAWADLAHVEAIQLVYVAQRWTDAAATMGHVIFRVRRKPGAIVEAPSLAQVFAYIAKEPTTTPGFLWKGLTGGLTAGVRFERFGDVYARYGLSDGRDMNVYELALDEDERRYLLAEVFSQERRHMQVPYAFLSTNCATLAYDTLRAVLPELPEHASLMMHPHEVVSLLLTHGRARPRGVIPARKSRALRGEADREALVRELAHRPEVALVDARRFAPMAERAAALRTLERALARDPPSGPEAVRLASYVDDVLDVESFVVDQDLGVVDAHATSASLEAALAVRAGLPRADETPEVVAFPAAPIVPSGSRQSAIEAGWTGTRALATWRTSVLDGSAGEPRQAMLRRASTMRLLDNALTLSSTGDGVDIEEERLIVVASQTWGRGVETDRGWLAARSGFAFGIQTWSRPRENMPFALELSIGPGLTLLASDDFEAHLVVAAQLALATWTGRGLGPLARAALGLVVEAATPLGTPLLRFVARGRLAPAVDLDSSSVEGEASARLDWVVAPQDGVILRLFGFYARGLPAGDGWIGGVGVAF